MNSTPSTPSAIDPTAKLLNHYSSPPAHDAGTGPTIIVNQTVSRMAFAYERIRNAIEFKEEHLFRKNAIARIIKRRTMLPLERRDLARDLITELIRGRYLPNNAIPESRVADVKTILAKYNSLNDELTHVVRGETRRRLREWLLSVEAYEIEKLLMPHDTDEALVEFMYDRLQPQVRISEKSIDATEKNIQIFIAVHRALLKSDDAVVRYYLFRLHVPNWGSPTPDDFVRLAARLPELGTAIEHHMAHPITSRLSRLMKRYAINFLVLRDVLDEVGPEASTLVAAPDVLEARIRKAVAKRNSTARTKIRRTVIRSIIYIIITKMILGLALEFPYDVFVAKHVDYIPLGINILFPPFLLAVIAMSARVPSESNTKKIVANIHAFLVGSADPDLFAPLQRPVTRRRLTIVFSFIYLVTYVITFGAIIYGLSQLNFNAVSMAIFILFLSIVSFFGLKVRGLARELLVINKRDNLFASMVDFFAVPILQLGRWISEKTPKINILIFVLDFILEAPFKTFIEVVEQWFSFIREKREEIY